MTTLVEPHIAGTFECDFRGYYNSALTVRRGRNPYELEDVRRVAKSIEHPFMIQSSLYPPLVFVVFQPFTRLSPQPADRLWKNLMGLIVFPFAYLLACVALPRRPNAEAFAVALTLVILAAPTRDALTTGNLDLVIALLVAAAAWQLPRGQLWRSSLVIALAASLKLWPALAIAGTIFQDRKRAPVWVSAMLLLTGLTFMACGPAIAHSFFTLIAAQRGDLHLGWENHVSNQSLYGTLGRVLGPHFNESLGLRDLVGAFRVSIVVMALAALWFGRRHPGAPRLALSLGFLTWFLAASLTWMHALTIAFVSAAILYDVTRGQRPQRWLTAAIVAGALLLDIGWGAAPPKLAYGPVNLLFASALYGTLLLWMSNVWVLMAPATQSVESQPEREGRVESLGLSLG